MEDLIVCLPGKQNDLKEQIKAVLINLGSSIFNFHKNTDIYQEYYLKKFNIVGLEFKEIKQLPSLIDTICKNHIPFFIYMQEEDLNAYDYEYNCDCLIAPFNNKQTLLIINKYKKFGTNTQLECQKYKQIIHNMSEGFAFLKIQYTTQGKIDDLEILDINSNMINNFKNDSKFDFINKTIKFIFPEISTIRKSWQEDILKILSGARLQYNYSKDHSDRFIRFNGYSPFRDHIVLISQDVSEIEKNKIEVEKNRDLLEQIIASIPTPIYYKNNKLEYEICNSHFAKTIIGKNKKSIIGKTIFDFNETKKNIITEYNNSDIALLNDGQPQYFEADITCADSKIRHFGVHKAAIKSKKHGTIGLVGIMNDLSMHKEVKDVLIDNEQKIKTFLEYIPVGVIIAENENIIALNHHAEIYFNFKKNEFLNKKISYFFDVKKKMIKSQITKNSKREYIQVSYVDRNIRTLLVTSSKIKVNGKNYEIKTFLDVSEMRSHQDKTDRINSYFKSVVSNLDSFLIGVNDIDVIQLWSSKCVSLFNLTEKEALGKKITASALPFDWASIYEGIARAIFESNKIELSDMPIKTPTGNTLIFSITIAVVKITDSVKGYFIFGRDVTHLREVENELNQASRIQAIGQLAAGIAHEINTPAQYINDNLAFIRDAWTDTNKVLAYIANIKKSNNQDKTLQNINEYLKNIDLKFYVDELPDAIEQAIEGIGRISTIVKSMKSFAHPESDKRVLYDIHKSIEDTITISKNEWKYNAKIETNLCKDSSEVSCYPGLINQVLLNLVVNAAHAIDEAIEKNIIDTGVITISTHNLSDFFVISIKDNGIGIDQETQHKIFEPFFTTKKIGKGTGQGLSLVYNVIKMKHKGIIQVKSKAKNGAEFIIKLPLRSDE